MSKIHLGNIILFFLFPLFVFSQKIDSVYVSNQINKAISLNKDSKFEKANSLLDQLIYSKSDFGKSQLAQLYQLKSKTLINIGLYKESIPFAKKSLQIYLEQNDKVNTSESYSTIGTGYFYISEYDSTKIYYEKSYQLKKEIKASNNSLAISAFNLAILYADLDQIEKALKLYFDAEKYLLKEKKSTSILPEIYSSISNLYFYTENIAKAEQYSEKAVNLGLKVYGASSLEMTFIYGAHAQILESKNNFIEAISLRQKSLEIRRQIYGENHRWTCEAYYKLAGVYSRNKQYEKAIQLYKKSIKIGIINDDKPFVSKSKSYLASVYIDQEKSLPLAEKLLLHAIKINTDIFGVKSKSVADNYYDLARVSLLKNDKINFFKYTSKVFTSCNYDIHHLTTITYPLITLNTIKLIEEWYKELYTKTSDTRWMESKFKLIDLELNLIEHRRKDFSSNEARINFANKTRDIFEEGLNTCWVLYYQTKEFKYLEKAFELLETNRNTTLLEGLQDVRNKWASNIPIGIQEFEKQIKQDLEKVKINLNDEKTNLNPDKLLISNLLSERIVLRSKLDSLRMSIEIDYPKDTTLKYYKSNIKISSVQNNLDVGTQLLTYFLGAKNLFSFNISKDTLVFLRDGIAKRLVEETTKFKNNLISQKDTRNGAKLLYQYLLSKQIDKSKSNVIIIPDNVLHYIPFEGLLDSKDNFFIENHTVSYNSSIHLFLELNSEYFNYKLPKYWVGFSPKYAKFSKLNANCGEVSGISEMIKGDVFRDSMSTKSSFLRNNKDYSILHLAMHVEVDHENPMFNRLMFSDDELTASEVYVSNTKANLAVLSACNTGFGKLEKGEGIMSMARAFHFSGVPSVMMSLWEIPDKETSLIMHYFYTHLSKNESKSEALKNAKLDYLANTKDINLKHPYYWAGFVLNGRTSALAPTRDYYLYIIGGFLLILSFLFWKNRM